MKKIMLVEPNPFHNEILPGIAKYLNELGYFVDVYIRKEMKKYRVFIHYHGEIAENYIGIDEICCKLKSNTMKEYDFLFLSSMEYEMNGEIVRFLDEVDSNLIQTRYGVMGIYHTTYYIEKFDDYKMMQEGRLFCLSEFQIHDFNLKTLNPHFFGYEAKGKKKIRQRKEFVVVGGSAGTEEISDVLAGMSNEERKYIRINWVGGKKRNFICNGIYVFIRNAAVSLLAVFLLKYKGKRCIRAFGYVSFSKLYKIIERSDYVLVMINDRDEKYKRYLTYSTSGIKQLILGFHKPCLIQKEVAELYNLLDTGIQYDRNCLSEGFRATSLINQNDYNLQCEKVNRLAKKIYFFSLENLKTSIQTIMERE